jgi:hypothetical protein
MLVVKWRLVSDNLFVRYLCNYIPPPLPINFQVTPMIITIDKFVTCFIDNNASVIQPQLK